MATQVASLFGLLQIDDTDWQRKLQGANRGIGDLGTRLQNLGRNITIATAPLAAGLGASVVAAGNFESSMTNAAAVLGLSADEMAALNAQVLRIGRASRQGPQAAAEAFYDIVGGVADASTHMAILEAAIGTAEAGNADLGGTTNALIAVMNSYGFSAEDAAYVSDVLTRTVGVGVGTMDEFGGALGMTAGLASSLGISFDDLGAMMGFITTQGMSASEAGTQLTAMMTSLLNPNERMKAALSELGVESGTAAIQMYGLDGVFRELSGRSGTFQSEMAGALGSVEALRGVTALGNNSAVAALAAFEDGLAGAMEAARRIQMQSAAAQFDLLKSQMSGLSITIGTKILPALNDLIKQIVPVIEKIGEWVTANPEAMRSLLLLVGAAVIAGPIITVLGGVIGALSTAVGVLTTVFTVNRVAMLGKMIVMASYRLQLLAVQAATWLAHGAQLAFSAVVGAGTIIMGGLTGALGLAKVALGGLATLMLTTVGPILAIGAAIGGVIAKIIEFNNLVGASRDAAATVVQREMAAGNLTRAQLDERSFNALASNFGGGVVGDVIARLFYSNVSDALVARADGGPVAGGMPYVVGERGPELFVPRGSGTIVPNEGMGGISVGNLTIYANDAAGGRAAADSFEAQMVALRRARG